MGFNRAHPPVSQSDNSSHKTAYALLIIKDLLASFVQKQWSGSRPFGGRRYAGGTLDRIPDQRLSDLSTGAQFWLQKNSLYIDGLKRLN
jgi:hypothetical protein